MKNTFEKLNENFSKMNDQNKKKKTRNNLIDHVRSKESVES